MLYSSVDETRATGEGKEKKKRKTEWHAMVRDDLATHKAQGLQIFPCLLTPYPFS